MVSEDDLVDGSARHCSEEDLVALAKYCRRRITETVQKNGGHLASNLGVVELTIALHRVFDFPRDRIIFDVSHQCYTHKLLTERDGEKFDHMRMNDGYSGYCDVVESPQFDQFTSGHEGTALAAALGLAVARDWRWTDEHIIALIGDGSLSCGLTLEALQHVGRHGGRITVVLNDNGYSIERSVGALAEHLLQLKNTSKDSICTVPCFFRDVYGMEYVGPIDGHNFEELLPALEKAKASPRPTLVHVLTKKGFGCAQAEAVPEYFHGVVAAGETNDTGFSGAHSYAEVLGRSLCVFGREDQNIVAVSAAMGIGTGLQLFAREFPTRFFDCAIAEGHALTFSAGLARGGLRPVCAIYSPFIPRAVDNFFHDICLQNLPLVLCLDSAGLSCSHGDTHHGLFDIAVLSCFPNVTFAQPSSLQEFSQLLKCALRHQGPFVIRYPRGIAGDFLAPTSNEHVPIGRAALIRRGSDISLWALGQRRLQQALRIADALERENLSAEVVNARFICPLDWNQLQKSARCPLVVSLEDHVAAGGFGTHLRHALDVLGANVRFLTIAWPSPVGFAENNAILENRCGQSTEQILEKIIAAFRATSFKIL
ncbi:MAG: 1-deoxy-D-xylulose-5-phosphate synthase [Puniceicoccales bacterium]|jgi:1-deoxy-D-xylulose-5-phosphate synthase|nr:1-deoxy-D-xylulose-5-phosphate synthase [Puniceicoccales bacterium]